MGAKQRWNFVACMGWGMASGKIVCSTGEGRSRGQQTKKPAYASLDGFSFVGIDC